MNDNVVTLTVKTKKDKYKVDYYKNEEGKITAVGSPDWPFVIQRKENEIALVHKESNEPFGILDADVFNTIIMCWLLIDDPELIEKCNEAR